MYALAATIYKCVTGITPEESIIRSKEDSLKYPSEYGVKISTNIENAIMHALSIDVTERTLTIDDFLDELHSKDSDIKKRLILNRWHIYGIVCIGLWVLSITVSYNLINNARRTKADKTESGNVLEESVAGNTVNKTDDDIDDTDVTIEKTKRAITTQESHTTEKNTEAEKPTEAEHTEEKTTQNTVLQKTTEKKTTEKKTEEKKTTEKKTTEKKNNKKKTTEKATTEKDTEVSTKDDTEETIYIED